MATDPYAAPRSRVADVPARADDGNFIADGQAVPAGNGWKWITDGWALFARQPGIWIAIVVVFLLIFIIVSLIPFVGGLAAALLGPIFAGGIMLGCRALDQGEELEFGHLFAGFRENAGQLVMIGAFNVVAWIVIGIVVALIVGASAFALFSGGGAARTTGSMMGIVLGVLIALALAVPVYMAIWFAAPLVALNRLDAVTALKTSFAACWKNIVPFLLYGVILFAFAILAAIPFGLGWLVLGPVVAASVYTAYRDIFYAS